MKKTKVGFANADAMVYNNGYFMLPTGGSTTPAPASKTEQPNWFQQMIPGLFAATTNTVFNRINSNNTGLAGDVRAVCGNKPLFNIGGKKDAYLQCAQNFEAAQIAAASAAAGNNQPVARQPMSTGAIVGIVGGSVLLVGGIVFAIVKLTGKATK